MAEPSHSTPRDHPQIKVSFIDVENVSIGKRVDDEKTRAESPPFGRRKRVLLTITLIIVNMVNYMDRNSVPAVLDDVKEYFHVNDSKAGLIRTLFILTLTVSVILFGYLGDRFNRLWLLTIGLVVWATVVTSIVFLPPSGFPLFVICRMLVGVGEGSVSTVAPAMISDMFKGRTRSILFACFSLMIPVGAGIGYVVYALLGQYFKRWQTGFYFPPFFCLLSVGLIWTTIRADPPRGKADGASNTTVSKNSLRVDLKHIFSQKTFVLLSIGHTLQLFVVGAVLFWTPDYAERSPAFARNGWSKGSGAVYFGIVTMGGGLAGVAIGGAISSFLKTKGSSLVSDAYICAGSSFFSAPLFFIGFQFGGHEIHAFYFMVFIIVACISTNWSVMMDASMYVIHPQCRSLAVGVQLLITKIGGEAWSAYVIGLISDCCQAAYNYKGYSNFYCLHSSLYLSCFMLVIAGFISACATWYIDEDKKRIDELVRHKSSKFVTHAAGESPELSNFRLRINSLASPYHRSLELPLDLPIDSPFDSIVDSRSPTEEIATMTTTKMTIDVHADEAAVESLTPHAASSALQGRWRESVENSPPSAFTSVNEKERPVL